MKDDSILGQFYLDRKIRLIYHWINILGMALLMDINIYVVELLWFFKCFPVISFPNSGS
jgi:hypothetical protein